MKKLIDEINSLVSQIFGYNQLVDELEQALAQGENFEESKAFIRIGYHKYLDELYDLKNNSNQKINILKDKYIGITGVQNLKISKTIYLDILLK